MTQACTDPSRGCTDPSRGGTDPSRGGMDPSRGCTDPSRGGTDPSRGCIIHQKIPISRHPCAKWDAPPAKNSHLDRPHVSVPLPPGQALLLDPAHTMLPTHEVGHFEVRRHLPPPPSRAPIRNHKKHNGLSRKLSPMSCVL